MTTGPLDRISNLIGHHRTLVVALLAVVMLAATLGLGFLAYNNDMARMLPADEGVQRTMRFLRESSLSQQVVLSLALNDHAHTTEDLIGATDQLIRSLHSPWITQVTGTMAGGDVMPEMMTFLRYTPQLLGAERFAAMTNEMTPEGVRSRLKQMYRQCLVPSSSFSVPFMRVDPLGASDGILRDVGRLFGSLGYDVKLRDGHFVSADARHTLVILKTPVVMTDSTGSRHLVDDLTGRLRALPAWVSGSLIAGHRHTLSNETIIRNDVRLTSIVAAVAFLSLFLLCFRDPRAGLIFATPLAAVVIAMNAAGLVFQQLSGFVVGLSTVIAGIAIDYGIYVYMAVRRAGNSVETTRRIIRPVTVGALTSISVFAVFFLSGVEGYRQLALLSTLSIGLCLLFALLILPHFLRQAPDGASPADVASVRRSRPIVSDRLCLAAWAAIVIGLSLSATRVTFNNDVTQYDGSGKDVLADEAEFHRVWGGSTMPAILVAPAATLEAAYERNDAIYRKAAQALGQDEIASLAAVWPSKATRAENLRRWQDFWTDSRVAQCRDWLAVYGQAYGFATNAFQPFFERLQAPAALEDEPKGFAFFDRLRDRFLVKTASGFEMLTFFPDRDRDLAAMAEVAKDVPGAFLVSQKNFGRQVARASMAELLFLSLLGIGATVLLTLLLLRNVRLTVLALVPVVTGLPAILGVMPLLGLSLSVPSTIAALVTVGIVSDYGMFVVYFCRHRYRTGTYAAVTLAAVSTLIGAGALLLARHPTLHAVGVTLVTGVLAGYVSSLLVVPPLYRLWCGGEE